MLQKIPKILTMYLILNIIVYAGMQTLVQNEQWSFITNYGVVPANFETSLWYVLITHSFVHLGIMHLVLNCLWALVFGTILARNISSINFMAFVLMVAVASSLGYIWLNPNSASPMIGASGVVSGFMGAALHAFPSFYDASGRFAISHRKKIILNHRYLNAIGTVLKFAPAVQIIVMVHVLNVVAAFAPFLFGSGTPIAWEVHIIGFWVGLLIAPLFFRKEL